MRITMGFGLAAVMALLAIPAGQQADAGTVTVTSFADYTTAPTAGVWYKSDPRTGTTGSSATITTEPSGGPLPPGAARLTTDGTNASMAEVGVANNYGTVSSILGNLNLSYSFYKAATSGNAAAAPSIKLTFANSSGDHVTLIYEPYWQSAHGGTVATDTWFNSGTIDENNGEFWSNGGFGSSNGAGGPPLKTLAGWSSSLNSSFQSASLVQVSVGLGSYTPNQNGYFDAVSINGTALGDVTYDFQVVPEPSTMVSACIAGLVFGGISWRRRKAARASA